MPKCYRHPIAPYPVPKIAPYPAKIKTACPKGSDRGKTLDDYTEFLSHTISQLKVHRTYFYYETEGVYLGESQGEYPFTSLFRPFRSPFCSDDEFKHRRWMFKIEKGIFLVPPDELLPRPYSDFDEVNPYRHWIGQVKDEPQPKEQSMLESFKQVFNDLGKGVYLYKSIYQIGQLMEQFGSFLWTEIPWTGGFVPAPKPIDPNRDRLRKIHQIMDEVTACHPEWDRLLLCLLPESEETPGLDRDENVYFKPRQKAIASNPVQGGYSAKIDKPPCKPPTGGSSVRKPSLYS